MEEQPFLITERLSIHPLTIGHENFIFELLNTEGWITFIGNRNIASLPDAQAYIQKVLDNPLVSYWVVRLQNTQETIGLVTCIKRDYLEHPDIGFAFLPRFSKKGYAYEATTAVLHKIIQERSLSRILATTVPQNVNSIALLKKIGLVFEKEIVVENETLHVYSALMDKRSR